MQNNNPLTSHILDTARGVPAAGVKTTLFKLEDDESWTKLVERLVEYWEILENIQ